MGYASFFSGTPIHMARQIDAGDGSIGQGSFQTWGYEEIAGVKFMLYRLFKKLHQKPLEQAAVLAPERTDGPCSRWVPFADLAKHFVTVACLSNIFRRIGRSGIGIGEKPKEHPGT